METTKSIYIGIKCLENVISSTTPLEDGHATNVTHDVYKILDNTVKHWQHRTS